MDKKKNRLMAIIDLLKERETMSVKELSEAFGVSEMTIRRDLEGLRKTNVIERSHGSATMKFSKAVPIDGGVYDIARDQIQHAQEKEAIARYAASLIEPNDFIIIDSGTTNVRIAKYIPQDKNISVLCYTFGILAELQKKSEGVGIIFAGGKFHPEDQMFTSRENVEYIRSFRANKMFIAASGFHQNLGITCIHSHEVENKKAAIASSATRILLIDSSKFCLVRPSYFATLRDIDILITDEGITREWRCVVEDAGIDLRIVNI